MSQMYVEITQEWQKAQVEIMLRTVLESISGLANEDEDLIDYWATKIPTNLKLNAELFDDDGKPIKFIEEWRKLNGSIKKDEPDIAKRNRILKKSQLITDILNYYKVWMKVFNDKSSSQLKNFNKPWKVNKNVDIGPAAGPDRGP